MAQLILFLPLPFLPLRNVLLLLLIEYHQVFDVVPDSKVQYSSNCNTRACCNIQPRSGRKYKLYYYQKIP